MIKIILFLLTLFETIFSKEPVVIVLKRAMTIDNDKVAYYSPKIYSSYEGHALVILEGYGFMNMQDSTINCVFIDSLTSSYIYKSQVVKEKTTCDINDYDCMYQQTSYQFSDTQIACYSPKIPEATRPTLFANPNWAAFSIYLEITMGTVTSSVKCSSTADCSIIYSYDYSPTYVNLGPSHFYLGSLLSLRLTPRAGTPTTLKDVKLGRNNCVPIIPEDFNYNYNDVILSCNTGASFSAERISDYMINYMSGYTNKPTYAIKQDVDPTLATKNNYYFKAFPMISYISVNKGSSTGGQNLRIKGLGFSPIDTKVFINADQCSTNLSVKSDEITCTSPATTLNLGSLPAYFIGSNGLRWRRYKLTTASIPAMIALAKFPDITDTTILLNDDIVLETATAPTNIINYGQYFTGYFKAIYGGRYRFWSTSDDASQLYLSTDDTAQNKVKIIDFNSWTFYNDYVTPYAKSRSDWVTLVAGNYYYMEIYHVQGVGADHYSVGVEIEHTINVASLSQPLPNKINKIQTISIGPKISRDVYEFVINTLTNNVYKLTCKSASGTSSKTITVDPNWTAAQFMGNIYTLTSENRLLVRKLGYNDANSYYLADGENANDASFTTEYGFGDMYINFTDNLSAESVPLTTQNTGTKTGVVFLVMVDRKLSQRTYKLENNCYLTTTARPIITIAKKQSVSSELTGTFSLKINDATTNISFNTPDITLSTLTSGSVMQTILNNIPTLSNKVQVFYVAPEIETQVFYVRIASFNNIVISTNTNQLTGGRDNTGVIRVADFVAQSDNLFFFPIPADFLFVKNTQPQVRVISNGIESVCLPTKCDYKIVDANTLPTVLTATYDPLTQAVTATIDNNFVDTTLVPTINVGVTQCGRPLNFNTGTKTYSCTLSNPIVGGSYKISLKTQLGDCNVKDTVPNFQIPLKITSITPTSISESGGTPITIIGQGFPNSIDSGFSVKAGNNDCVLQTVSNTQIVCLAGAKVNSDPLTITYNTVTVKDTTPIFSFSAAASPPPSIQSATPNNVSPGEKQFIDILFSADISTYNIANIIVKLVHKTLSNYIIMMNPKRITTNTLNVKYGGAAIGEYNIYVQLDATTYATGSITFTSVHTITAITPNVGSTIGGTEVTITGTNFLSTQLNQMIFIGKTPCTYVSNTSTKIVCTTNPANSNTAKDVDLYVSVDQMIQYYSKCTIDNGNGCLFKYSTEKTAILNSVVSANNDYIFSLNDQITINGSNFAYTSAPAKLIFTWGEITITGGDNTKNLIGTVSTITAFGMMEFKFSNNFGLAIHQPTGPSVIAGKSTVFIVLKKPQITITAINPSPFGEFGGIFKFVTTATDFTTNLSSSGQLLNSVQICTTRCDLLKTNILTGGDNNFQCIISTATPAATFASCPITLGYYDLSVALPDANKISADATKNYSILTISVNNILITLNTFTIADPSNFNIQITLNSDKIDFANLKLIVDNRYVFIANTPGVLTNGKATYTFPVSNGLPAGQWPTSVFEDGIGFLAVPVTLSIRNNLNAATSSFLLKVPAKITTPGALTNINSSFFGGFIYKIEGVNLNSLVTAVDTAADTIKTAGNLQNIAVCGIPAKIIDFKSNYIKFETPTVMKYNLFSLTKLVTDKIYDLSSDSPAMWATEYYTNLSGTNMNLLFDNNPYTKANTITSSTISTYIGVKILSTINQNFKIYLKKVKILAAATSKTGDFDNGVIEGSNDGSSWTKITSFPKNLPTIWYTINIDYSDASFNGSNRLFKYVRVRPNTTSAIAEVRFLGIIVYDSNDTSLSCDITLTDSFNNVVLSNLKIVYNTAITYSLSAISPNQGSSVGGNTVRFSLTSAQALTGSETVTVSIFGNKITTAVTIDTSSNPQSLTLTMIARNNDIYDSNNPLVINVSTLGNVYSDIIYKYQDRWSDTNTWGGEYIPANGETAYIKNTDVLLDVPEINLNTLVIENGSLTVEDTRDYKMSAMNIMIRSGKLVVGTEQTPFTHNFELTMKATKSGPVLPIFGNKVIAVLEGQIELHGVPRTPVHTIITKTANPGDSTITVLGPVDWKVGEEIIIVSSSSNYDECELRKIAAISNSNTASPLITLDSSLLYHHYGDLETYGTDTIDMRAEVGLLTRNVVIQGDEDSEKFQYGVHIMITAMNMDMNTNAQVVTGGKISYIRVRRAGQAFQLGRYPIHFHMIGDVSGSFIRGCAIHNTYNRAITIHAVNNFLVESNIAYNTMGHTFFIEDSVETNNIVRNNMGVLTKSSNSLLNTDFHPATFWITHPSNFFEGNHACGSARYGFWMDLPVAPTGMNSGKPGCPREQPLGSFKNNFSHSNGQYGLRIFPEFNPKNKACEAVDDSTVTTAKAVFSNITIYRNKERGFITERVGDVVFDGFKVADNSVSSMEVSDILPFSTGMATIQNALIIGKSKNPAIDDIVFETNGLTTPRADRFLVDNVKFYSFGQPNMALFSSCSRCEHSGPSTDSGARTIYFKRIFSDNTQNKNIRWNMPKRDIYRDLDGTLSGSTAAAWVTPFWQHNFVKECKRDADLKFDDALICDDTVQLRRVAFNQLTPSSTFVGQPLKILRLASNLESISISQMMDTSQFSNIPFKEKKDPNFGWAVPFITGYNYLLSFTNVANNFDSLALERSKMWDTKDKPINLVFNYTFRRDEFVVSGVNGAGASFNVTNSTDLVTMNKLTDNSNLPYGTFHNNIAKKNLYMRINSYNPLNLTNNLMKVTAVQCTNNNCGLTPPDAVPIENFVRRWSDPTNWVKVPADGDDVEIKKGWNMLLDVVTPNLKTVTINGNLIWDPVAEFVELKAQNILVYSGRLEIGTRDSPYTKKTKVTLLGNRFTNNIAINNIVKLPNKVLASIGEISMFGEDRSPYTTKLLNSAKIGDTKITVGKNLKWKLGDEIVIGTTSFNPNQTERVKIMSYNSTTGDLSIYTALQYAHYGAADPTKFADNPLNPPINLDERADVYMITRNIRISGSLEDWGCNIFTTKFQAPDFLYVGRTNLSHVEVTNCGQTDTEFSAVTFNNHNNILSVSLLEGLSFYDNPFSGITITNSNQVTLQSIIEFQMKKHGVSVLNSQKINLNDISVVQMQARIYPTQMKLNKILDMNACFYICPEPSTCKDVVITNSTCAGSDKLGFLTDAYDCSFDLKYSNSYNRAYATQLGFLVMNPSRRDCLKFGNVISYHNLVGFGSYAINNLGVFENIISANDIQGVYVANGALSNINTRRLLRRTLIVGQNKENPVCVDKQYCEDNMTPCKQTGFMFSLSGNMGLKIPLDSMSFPVNSPHSDAAWGSFLEAQDIVFANFEDQCSVDQTVFNSNPDASDMSSLHLLKNVVLSRVLEDNLFFFEKPNPSWAGDACGGFPCTGPNNAFLKVENFLPTKELMDASTISKNSKWKTVNGTIVKKYAYPNYATDTSANQNTANKPTLNITDGMNFLPLNPFGPLQSCTGNSIWNGQYCLNVKKLGVILFENIDGGANERAIAPVTLVNSDYSEQFTNVLNSFKDHSCENGYPSHKRTPRFPSIVTLNKQYNITFASTNPKTMKFQLLDPNWDNKLYTFNQYVPSSEPKQISGILIRIKYANPQTVLVFNYITKVEIKSKEWKDGDDFRDMTCGSNKWTPVQNLLEFYITNSPDCMLLLNTVNSIQLSLRMDISVEDFYSKNGNTQLIYNIAASLGIPPDQIRITSVMKGSTIVLTHILQKKAQAIDDTTTDSTSTGSSGSSGSSSSSTQNDNQSLDLTKAMNTIVNNIQSGALRLPAPVMNLDYNIIKSADANPNGSTDSSNANADVGVNSNSIVIKNPITPTTSTTNPTNPTTTNTGNSNSQPSSSSSVANIPINGNPNSKDADEGLRNIYIIVFTVVPVTLILIGVLVGILVHRYNKKKNENEHKKMIETAGHIPIPASDRLGNVELISVHSKLNNNHTTNEVATRKYDNLS